MMGTTIIQKSTSIAPGNSTTAFRAELFGMVSWYCCLFHLMEFLNLESNVHIQTYTDNTLYLHTPDLKPLPYFDDYDLYSYLQKYSSKLIQRGLTFSPIQKIASHPQTAQVSERLPEHLHTQADTLARQFRIKDTQASHLITSLESAYLTNADGAITNHEKHIMETTWPTKTIENYYMQRWDCSNQYLTTLDWITYDALFQALRPSLQKFLIKILTGWLPVRHHLNKMLSTKQTCPLCPKDETLAHLFQCQKRKQWHQNFLQQLEEKLSLLKTPPQLRTSIITHYQQRITDPATYHQHHHFIAFVGLFPNKWKNQYSITCGRILIFPFVRK